MDQNEHNSGNEAEWDDDLLIKAYRNSIKGSGKAPTDKKECRKTIPSSVLKLARTASKRFNEGSYVRATYEDGIDYEAKILAINKENGTCVIKYIGFDNEEEVELSALVNSFGKKARRTQFLRARKPKSNYKDNSIKTVDIADEILFDGVPPIPPIPPVMTKITNSDHLQAMIMAWYMSGYYTAVYEENIGFNSTR